MKLLTVLLVLLAGCNQAPAQAPQAPQATETPNHYQLAVDQDGNAWRLDTITGQMVKCWKGTPNVMAPSCFAAGR